MADLAQGYRADIILNAGDVVRIGTTGTATVTPAYGAPSGVTTLTAQTREFGPYSVPAKLVLIAVSGSASYSKREQTASGEPVSVTGTPEPGQVLARVVAPGWIDSGGNWTQDGSNISGATGTKIYLTGSHSAKDISYKPGGIPFAPVPVRVSSLGLLATAAKVAAMGDSIVERAFDPSAWPWSSGSEVSSSSKAAITWAKRLDPRFQWFAFYSAGANRARGGPNRGGSGETAAQNLARMSEITGMSPAPGVFYLASGTNSIRDAGAPSAEAIFADLVAMITAARGAFPTLKVLFSTIRATCSTSLALTYGITEAQRDRMLDVNQRIRNYCAANASFCSLVDAFQAYALPDGYGDPALFEDGLHPNQKGAFIEYRDHLGPALNSLVTPGIIYETGTNLFPLDWSVPGGAVTNGVTGSVPNGMQGTRTVGSGSTTVVASMFNEESTVKHSDKFGQVVPKVQYAFTPGGTAIEQFRFGFPNTFSAITIPNNAWVRFMVDVEADDYAWQYIQAELYLDTTSGVRSVGGKGSLTLGYATRGFGGAYVLATEAIPCAGTTANLLARIVAAVDGNQGGAPRVKFSNPRFVVATTPSTL